jgi:hypothetical protein
MKRYTKKLTKMQRKARSKRKTWTNARQFELRNERAKKEQALFVKAMKKLKAQLDLAGNQPIDPAAVEPKEVVDAEFIEPQ